MDKRPLGNTSLEVTPLGLGTAEIGFTEIAQADADRLLAGVLDAGINVIDTAACYDDSEVKIGRAIADRRDEYVLITKCGHAVDNLDKSAWSPALVTASIERSLRRLKTDHLDMVLLHSCDLQALENQAMLEALLRARHDGKTRAIGYSGDGSEARAAVGMEVFQALETSVSIADQQAITRYLPQAHSHGLGVIAKRPIANGAWRKLDDLGEFYGDYAAPYAKRIEAMQLTPQAVGFDGSWIELALRFTLFEPHVTTAIVGSTNLDHIRENIEIAQQGALPRSVLQAVRDLWTKHDDGSWTGQT
jgi:aryl-alcohol dehydrogenase-like predicted oxidoreductase